MNRVFLLLAEFETADIPLEKICEKYFGIGIAEAMRKARAQQLPVAVFRCGGQRSGWLVSVKELARYLDEQERSAMNLHQKMSA